MITENKNTPIQHRQQQTNRTTTPKERGIRKEPIQKQNKKLKGKKNEKKTEKSERKKEEEEEENDTPQRGEKQRLKC